MTGFVEQVAALAAAADRIYAGTPGHGPVLDIRARLAGPLRVAIAGRVKAGKSTLLNALVGEELAPTDAGECTQVPWWFRDGLTYRVTVHPHAGTPRPARFTRTDGALLVDLEDLAGRDLDRIDVEWPSRALRAMTLIDTPGISSATSALSDAANRFFDPEEERGGHADAVIYLMRHLHAADVGFLESFSDDGYAAATPVNTIAVLSRADQLGVSRLDAMDSAARVAERYRRDRRLSRLCQAVVPVAGLVAQAAVTLREEDYRLVRQVVELPEAELDELLLSVDRFAARPGPAPPAERVALLRRLGLFGTRTAVALVRAGRAANAGELAAGLQAVSGVEDLRRLLSEQFVGRRDLLQGRAALVALAELARSRPVPGAEALEADIERVQTSAHELVEMRLLNALRTGEVVLRTGEEVEATRLLGAEGPGLRARLGLDAGAGDEEVLAAFADVLGRWQRRAANPIATGPTVEAARALVRTCEALAASLPGDAGPPDGAGRRLE